MPGDVRAAAEQYFSQLTDALRAVDVSAIERAVNVLLRARLRDKAVYLVGNGGSAATCSHFANDLVNAVRYGGGLPFRVFSLANNEACLTGISNDEGYERVFAARLENYLRPGDVVIAISASGNSMNLVRSIEAAKRAGAVTVGIVGFDGGRLYRLVDEAVLVRTPIGAYGPVEDIHLILGHLISERVGHAFRGLDDAPRDALEECVVS